MKPVLSIPLLVVLFTFCAAVSGTAQISFTALDGLPRAQTEAQSSLAPDAELILIGAPGSFQYQAFNLSFNENSGESSVWMYAFYSEAKDEVATFLVIRLLGYQAFELESVPFPIPNQLVTTVETSGSYADSDDMVIQLRRNSKHQEYKEKYPNNPPRFLTLSQLIDVDSIPFPTGFPVGEATWTVRYAGQGDSAMICFVASESGETFCQARPNLSVGTSVQSLDVAERALLHPNPTNGSVSIRTSGHVKDVTRILLVRVDGSIAKAFNPASIVAESNGVSLELDGVNAGSYFLLIEQGKGKRSTARVVVVD